MMASKPDFVITSPQTPGKSANADRTTRRKKKKRRHPKGFRSASEKTDENRLKTSAWHKEKHEWDNLIKKHREDVKNAKSFIDDRAPLLDVSSVYDVETMNSVWKILRAAFDVNVQLVKKLHEVNVTGGKTATFSYNYGVPQASSYNFRKIGAKRTEKENKVILKRLKTTQTRMMTVQQHAEEWKRHEKLMEGSSQFPLWWKVKCQKIVSAEIVPPPKPPFQQHVTEKSAKYPDKRPRVFLEIAIRKVGVLGRMVVVLYSDYVPMTVKNFLAFADPKASLTYKGNSFYFIFKDFYCQTGDVVENRGFGGTSIYGPYFGNEDTTLPHAERGVLTMFQKAPDRNASQFLITFRKLESLNGKNVVFGKVIKGLHVLSAIESFGSDRTGRPRNDVYISDCDEI